jgi:K+-transporting ATPase ATPase A chain
MSSQAVLTVAGFLAVLVALAQPLSVYMTRLADGAPLWKVFGTAERALYRAAGVDPAYEMPWTTYAIALVAFNGLGAVVVYTVQRLQAWLPLNPQGLANVAPDSAFDTAVSFVTNTNWQAYAGESTMSYFTQMTALAGQNFFSAATGLAVAFALVRGFARGSAAGIGNFWVDLTRGTLGVLLPLSLALAVLFMGQGVIQNFSAYRQVRTLEPLSYAEPQLDAAGVPRVDAQGNPVTQPATTLTQTLPMGPVASQDARHQRRRLFQRQLGASVREPDAARQFCADARNVLDTGGPVPDVRPNGGRHAPRLGGTGLHDHHIRRHGAARLVG